MGCGISRIQTGEKPKASLVVFGGSRARDLIRTPLLACLSCQKKTRCFIPFLFHPFSSVGKPTHTCQAFFECPRWSKFMQSCVCQLDMSRTHRERHGKMTGPCKQVFGQNVHRTCTSSSSLGLAYLLPPLVPHVVNEKQPTTPRIPPLPPSPHRILLSQMPRLMQFFHDVTELQRHSIIGASPPPPHVADCAAFYCLRLH